VLEVGLGVAIFTTIVMCLVLVISLVRARLVAAGEVEIRVNDRRTLQASVGGRLLRTLTDSGIHVPSACGGIGTCGQCRVHVLEGGGPVLPTETARIARREVLEGVRLACQVTIREDMRIRVPEEIFGVKQWECTLRSARNVGTMIRELVLELPEGETLEFRAGGFVQIECPPFQLGFRDFEIDAEYREEWDRLNLWRYEAAATAPTTRAYSMANYPEENEIIMLLVRLATPPPGSPDWVPPGVVSSYLFGLKPGDRVQVSGPFGHFFAEESDREMIFIGGGAGMAPMRAHILDQLVRLKSTRKISFWYGARNLRELFYVELFDGLQAQHDNFRWVVALSEPRPEDQWTGEVGFIHQVLYDRFLKDHPAPEECEYYLCGPPMMAKAVLTMLEDLGVEPESIRFDDFGEPAQRRQ
jgi:Na+-transporting NADH:ubiquinone oxidoreductase subunit F